ncbi:LysM peptidoglycan-binding domain-containing protein [bacterium]|nr:LysM peptidoglycan-binding domain-containing protein [bacterium]
MSQRSPNQFYFVERGDSLWKIAKHVYGVSDNGSIARKVQGLIHLNPHIRNPDKIHPGQVLNLGNATGFTAERITATEMQEIERILNEDRFEVPAMLDHWNPIMAAAPVGADVPDSGLWKKVGKATVKSALKTGEKAAKGDFANLLKVSPYTWRKVEAELVDGLRNRVRYLKNADGTLGLIPDNARAFSRAGKVILVDPAPGGGFRAFASQVRAGKDFSKKFLKPASRAVKVISLGSSAYSVYSDWGTVEQNRTLTKEVTKSAVSIIGLTGAGAAATGVCGFLTLTTGVGGVACYATLFIAVSVGESYLVDEMGDLFYEGGNKLYYKFYEGDAPLLIN